MYLRLGLFALVLLLPFAATAQGVSPLSIEVSPAHPHPYENIVIIPKSTVIDLSRSTVRISVNGAIVGNSPSAVAFKVGGPGERTAIHVSATYLGITYGADLVLRPQDVSIVSEALSTTHPFYKGAALASSGSRVRLVALADLRVSPTSRLSGSSLSYTWRVDGRLVQQDSGVGRSSITLSAPVQGRGSAVSVLVASQDQSVVGEGEFALSPVFPVLRIYESSPLFGVRYDRALLGDVFMKGSEATFVAIPYFAAREKNPAFSWAIDGKESETKSSITVRTTGSGSGENTLSIAALLDTFTTLRFAFTLHYGQ